MYDNGKKTWLVIDVCGYSQVCRTVGELEDLLLGDNKEVIGDNYEIIDISRDLPDMGRWKVYEVSGSEAVKIDISFEMKLSIRF